MARLDGNEISIIFSEAGKDVSKTEFLFWNRMIFIDLRNDETSKNNQ